MKVTRTVKWFGKEYEIEGTLWYNSEILEEDVPEDTKLIIAREEDYYALMNPQHKDKITFVYREEDLRRRYR